MLQKFCFRHIRRPAVFSDVIEATSRVAALDELNTRLRKREGVNTGAKIVDLNFRLPANRELKQYRIWDAERGHVTVFYFPEEVNTP